MTKHIQAYFKQRDNAEAAATSLRALGARDVTTDRTAVFDHFEDDPTEVLPMVPNIRAQFVDAPLPSMQPSGVLMRGLDPEPGVRNQDDDVSLAGTPVLSAAIDDNLYDKAMQLVKKYGGSTYLGGAD